MVEGGTLGGRVGRGCGWEREVSVGVSSEKEGRWLRKVGDTLSRVGGEGYVEDSSRGNCRGDGEA